MGLDLKYIAPSNFSKLPYALFGVKQGNQIEELITRDLVNQMEWNFEDWKKVQIDTFWHEFRIKMIKDGFFCDFLKLGVQFYLEIR